ncbi:unnamed protein product [Lactuca saligna]|uniref:Uncharacterized protein n=1 Tax=Lactuca saligna TaxID=75948 RepID=A0AA36E4U0_LACSI|nr:unnamed protein product [Lactuca saligna]
MGSINNGGGGGGENHIIDAFGRLLTCVLRHMAYELNLKMRKDEPNLGYEKELIWPIFFYLITKLSKTTLDDKGNYVLCTYKRSKFGVIEVFLGLQVHGMLSQMDPALVSYCEKIAENGGPLTLPEKIGGSVHVAQMETTMTRASSLLWNVQPEVNVDQSYEDIKLNRGIHDALASEEAFFQSHPKAKAPELSAKKLFGDLPRLWHRVKAPQPKDVAQLALKKMPSTEQETISMSEYQRGVGAWNFDLEDLKFKASLEASNSKATTIGKHSTRDIESSDEVVPSESLINKESKVPKTDDKGSIIVEEKSRKETEKPEADKEAAVAHAKNRILTTTGIGRNR